MGDNQQQSNSPLRQVPQQQHLHMATIPLPQGPLQAPQLQTPSLQQQLVNQFNPVQGHVLIFDTTKKQKESNFAPPFSLHLMDIGKMNNFQQAQHRLGNQEPRLQRAQNLATVAPQASQQAQQLAVASQTSQQAIPPQPEKYDIYWGSSTCLFGLTQEQITQKSFKDTLSDGAPFF
ncbi:13162_t:CDS:2 [Acaulospora colombiana]|uniref:13162_t:CDS:1 n=1 Tax=Acaulospora colombiana TaxID=27376 RepID=A0ACA9KVD3_9GLOM|nr:13162_t:CDS:2 [Acaulospora colombiana]